MITTTGEQTQSYFDLALGKWASVTVTAKEKKEIFSGL